MVDCNWCIVTKMNELVRSLDCRLAQSRADYYARLQPGLGDPVIDEFQSRFGFVVPSTFRDLYRWRDGQSADCFESLADNWMFSPLGSVTTTKEMLDGMIGYDFEAPGWWCIGWVPFLSNGGGDHLCLDLTAESGCRSGRLISFWHDRGIRPIEFPSMEDWLRSIIDRLSKRQ